MKQQMVSLSDEASRLIMPLVESKNFSKFVEDCILKNLKDEKTIERELQEKEKEVEKLQDQLKTVREFNLKTEMEIAKEEEEAGIYETAFWKNCINILESRGREYADGQRMSYNNQFNKNYNTYEFLKKYEEMLKKLGVQENE